MGQSNWKDWMVMRCGFEILFFRPVRCFCRFVFFSGNSEPWFIGYDSKHMNTLNKILVSVGLKFHILFSWKISKKYDFFRGPGGCTEGFLGWKRHLRAIDYLIFIIYNPQQQKIADFMYLLPKTLLQLLIQKWIIKTR